MRDNLQSNDVLIVSVGGNDIALSPTPCTIASMVGLICCTPQSFIKNGFSCWSCPLDDCCCGCGTSTLSCLGACPPCLGYLRHLFKTRVEKYIQALTAKTKPKKVLVCMIYYLDENVVPSWAGAALSALGYNSNPSKLQSIVRKGYLEATSQINVPGVEKIIPVPLYQVLDGKNSDDYIARVEPSSSGGQKLAEFLLDVIEQSSADISRSSAPLSYTMFDR